MLYAFSATLSSYSTPPIPERVASMSEIFGNLVLAQATVARPAYSADSK